MHARKNARAIRKKKKSGGTKRERLVSGCLQRQRGGRTDIEGDKKGGGGRV